ncbi:MAG: hypothetical protein ABFE02_17635 [Sulfuricella sp.]
MIKADYVVRGIDVVGTETFYTGKVGQEFVSPEISAAFPYESVGGARRKAAALNRMMAMHGWRFIAYGRLNANEKTSIETVEMFLA